MGNLIFNRAATFLLTSGNKKHETVCSVKVAGIPSINRYALVDRAGGKSMPRVQVDVALDGTLYVAGTTKDVGEYYLSFIDPELPCSSGPSRGLAAAYLSTEKLSDRKITITLQSSADSAGKYSTSGSSILTGIITSVDFKTEVHNECLYQQTTLRVVGYWSAT